MTRRKIQYWVIPPQANSEFVAAMENVLDTYSQPDDERFPVLCMDEQPVQLLKETRVPIAAARSTLDALTTSTNARGPPAFSCSQNRFPAGGWSLLASNAPKSIGPWKWRTCSAPGMRKRNKFLVCENLNTHTRGAFYAAFPAAQARDLVRRLDFRFTPKHGSWLNISENELSSMTRQCLKGRRLADIHQLPEETQAWATASNDKQRGADWQFTITDARNKLTSLYPKIKN